MMIALEDYYDTQDADKAFDEFTQGNSLEERLDELIIDNQG